MREKIHDAKTLAEILEARRRQPPAGKLVFTNGCFDLLHVGHLRYLWEARKLGGALIVAVNDDASVQRLKGPARPILKLSERLEVLAGLACVDYATWFAEDTPLEIITRLRPDVLIKGANYALDEIVGRAEVESWGGAVLTLPMIEGRSTSALIEKVQALKTSGK